jgi:hypothetical protein
MLFSWSRISPGRFEELVAAVLRAMGYQNVQLRTGGDDDGWDIDAELHRTLPDGSVQVEPWRVECKRHMATTDAKSIRDHYTRMADTLPIPDFILFVTTAALSNPTKRDLVQSAAKDRIQIRYWEREELERHVRDSLNDPAVRTIAVASCVEASLSFSELKVAGVEQASAEIARRAAAKFIPTLCRPRAIEGDIRAFIAEDSVRTKMQEAAARLDALTLPKGVNRSRWRSAVANLRRARARTVAERAFASLLDLVEGIKGGSELTEQAFVALAGEKVRSYSASTNAGSPSERLARASRVRNAFGGLVPVRQNCFLVKDRAGRGKTNLLCRVATGFEMEKVAVVLLACRFDLSEATRLEETILRAIATGLVATVDEPPRVPSDPQDLLREIVLALEREGAQLVVLLDGINENRDLTVLDESITRVLAQWNTLPIKFVVTCRDIFWAFFREESWQRFLYREAPFSLPEFNEDEIKEVLIAYFRHFGITCRLVGHAREKCRHPLLLRFFCEAYRNKIVGEVDDLRLKDLFDEYKTRKCRDLAEALGWGTQGEPAVEQYLLTMVDHLLDTATMQLTVNKLVEVTGQKDMSSAHSLYRRLLDQDVIIEEQPPESSLDRSFGARRVGFVYDEFFDYMSALAHIRRRRWDDRSEKEICVDFLEVLRRSINFEQLRGVAEYMILLSERRGIHQALASIVARLGLHEVVCNALPKLPFDSEWSEHVLRQCVLSGDNKTLEAAADLERWLVAQPDDIGGETMRKRLAAQER